MNERRAARDTSQRLRAEHRDMVLSMAQIVTSDQETQKYFQNILGPLSLFSSAETDDVKKRDKVQERREDSSTSDKIVNVPASLSEFSQQLRSRISQHKLHTFSSDDKETLTAVMSAELSLIWQDLSGLPADPALTVEENKQLRSRTFDEVMSICEHLYLHYLHLLKTLGKRAVFSQQVNRSRLASYLAMDLSRLLNAHSIQRSVAMGIKAMRDAGKLRDKKKRAQETHANDFLRRLDISPNKHAASMQQRRKIEKDLTEIQEKIGELDLERAYDLMPCQLKIITSKVDTPCSTDSVPTEAEEDLHLFQGVIRLKGCNSMPDLQRELQSEELKLAQLPARPLSPLVLLSTHPCSIPEKNINPAEDLRRLLQDMDLVDKSMPTDSEADIPPLIRASVHSGPSKLKELTHMLQVLEEEEKQKMKSQREGERHPQAAVESVKLPTQGIVRIAAARVSDRVLPETTVFSMYPPVYNDFTGEIEPSSVTWLDRNLFDGTEIKEVYKELSKSLPDDYLHFDKDPVIEAALNDDDLLHDLKWNLEKKLMNSSLQIPKLNGISHRKRKELADHKRPTDVTSRAYKAWHQWWKSNLSLDDYLNYLSEQDSDYLSVVFHLYDSDDSDEADERKTTVQMSEKKRKQQEKTNVLKRQKQAYQSGLWNVNTVLMGGLWKEPVKDEEEGGDKEIQHECGEEDYNVPLATNVEEEQIKARLEKIWKILCLPETQRLDMAIKYSTHEHREKLEEMTVAWEQAAQLIQQRERVLSQLERFERVASDPSRFFKHGYYGTSAARMKEATDREKLESQIAAVDKMLSKTIRQISISFNDTVTYKGRPYREKMRWDRVEMLYWLQQERRLQALETVMGQRGNLPARLPPLNSTYRLYSGTQYRTQEDRFPLAGEGTIQSNELLSSLELCAPCTVQTANKYK